MHVDTEWRNAILGSLVVHLLLVAAMLFAAWDWTSTRRPNRTGLNIEARVVDINQFQQQMNQVREQRDQAVRAEQQRLERERRAQQRDEALQQQRDRDEQARLERERQQQEQVDRQQAEQEQRERQQAEQAERDRQAELQRQQADEAERRRQELETHRLAEQQRQREQEASRQRELEQIRQQREEAERRRELEQQRLQQLDDQQRREDEIRREEQLEAERQAAAQVAANAGRIGTLREQYQSAIQATVLAAWIRPPSVVDQIVCAIRIVQIPGGEVIDAVITSPCNADSATQRSIIAAVKRDDLPYRGFEEVFERDITFIFSNRDN